MRSPATLNGGPPPWSYRWWLTILVICIATFQNVLGQTQSQVSFSESAIVGSRRLLEPSTLPGGGQDSSYIIGDGNEGSYFQLKATKSQDGRGVAYLHLETRKKLDRELTPFFDLNISSPGGGRVDYLDLRVNILDINDNPPVFERSEYLVSVNESTPIGSSLIQVQANDADEGKNAEISYFMANANAKFGIDSRSGLLSIKSPLRCEEEDQDCLPCLKEARSCSLVIVATDGGQPRQSAQTVVKVALLDTNDHDPKISFIVSRPDPTLSFASVDEKAKSGTSVAAITVSDPDRGVHGEAELEVISGNEQRHFEVQSYGGSLYVLRVASRARFQRGQVYNLTLKATDKGSPRRTSLSSLTVKVNEVNEFKPNFDKGLYEVALSEALLPGSSVIVVQAIDEDTNADLTFEILGDDQGFKIHSKSGLVITREPLDRETKEAIELKLKVNDGSHEDLASLVIRIQDINDVVPKFEQDKYTFVIEENTPPRQSFATVKATDLDLGENGRITFSVDQDEHQDVFGINQVTGEIFAKTNLDREQKSNYELKVVASDNGNIHQLSSSVIIQLVISDANDNSPMFYPTTYHTTLPKTRSDLFMVKLQASDADEGSNSALKFQWLEQQTDFILDEATGDISVDPRFLALLKTERNPRTLKVVATDGGGRKSPTPAQIIVYPINNVIGRSFDKREYTFDIEEDSQLRQPDVGRPLGSLGNLQDNLELVHGDEDHVFETDGQGSLKTRSVIDREKKEYYELKVITRNPEGFDEALVKVFVKDLNDNLPVFDLKEPEILEVDKKSPLGHSIHRVQASDQDAGLNGDLRFMLDDNNQGGLFEIETETGVIKMKSNQLSTGSYDVTVKVTDLGLPALTNLKSYIINVVNEENDHTPVFDFDLYEISLSEGTLLNSEVISMTAVDLDQNEETPIQYAIIDNNNDNKFGIFPDGKIYLADKLDREKKAYYSVIVTASDSGKKPFARSSTSTLVIYVTDENDNTPILDKNEYVFYLEENNPADTVIGRISASDLDLGRNAEITYRFASDSNLFAIDEQSGFITTKKSLDREAMTIGQDSFDLVVIVSDRGVVAKSISANINIVIVDQNDNSPQFSTDLYEAVVSEAAKRGTKVIKVVAKDEDKAANGQVRYRILDNDDEVFEIKAMTGEISLSSQLDREVVDKYQVVVLAEDQGSPALSSTCTVKIRVSDENDEVPKFARSKIQLKLSEGVDIGHELYQFSAQDNDQGTNGKVNYFLNGNNVNGFLLDPDTGIMTVGSKLDRESRDQVNLVVTAVDNGANAKKTGTVMVSIEITDVNDNTPVFQTTAVLVNVKEDIAVGTKIAKIDAVDPDEGQNGKITFSMIGGDIGVDDTFRIDSETGNLYTKKEIDRELQDRYEITITAQDKGLPKALSSEKVFTIVVEDVNDNIPEITSLNTALVLPGATRGTPILTVRATDLDASSNGAITYKLKEQVRLFKLDSITGELKLNQDMNSLDQEPARLTVIASDGAVPSARKSSSASITIIGGRPRPGLSFTTELYEAKVTENSPVGIPVVTVSLNGDPQERTEFYIVGCESDRGKERNLFEVDKYSGQIKTSRVIDREVEGSTIIVQVVALIGKDKMSGTKVKITCLDENDSKPKFDKNSLNKIRLSEAYLPGHQVGAVQAVDPDLNSIMTYSLGLATQSFMKIDAQSGALSLTSSIDREIYDSLEVSIVASDGLHTTQWNKRIPIEDVNDNAPVFPMPQFSFDIMENVERGSFVGKIEAMDSDKDDKITYNFISDWGLDTFSIDPTSGIITLSGNSLDHEHIEHYILTVSASDSGTPVLTATSTVYVNVKDVNDNAPDIEQSLYEFKIPEDLPIGNTVGHIVATDKDSDFNTDLQFSIDDSVSNVFQISKNGTITTLRRLDREETNFYTFVVTVADTPDTHNQKVSSCVVQITVDDVNDQVPQFEPIDRLEIAENSPANTPVAAIRAVDDDINKNAEIEYLLEDSLGGKFSIGRIDGVLRSVKSLDREEQDVYSLSITAIDNGSPRLSSRVEIIVNVVDMNDNPPRFEQKQYSASVLENASIGMDILDTQAFDLDVGDNGRLRYSIIAGDQRGDFMVGESSGILRVSKRLDYERQNSYTLTIQAEDSGLLKNYDTAEVSILLIDTNDNAPIFEHSPYTVHVLEEDLPLLSIFTVEARDRDGSAAYNDLEYNIRAGGQHDDFFHVNSSTGKVYIKSVLDREKLDRLTLEVIATDSGSPRLTGTGTLYVVVDDVNDHEPTFENELYEFAILENSAIGTLVSEVIALDPDDGDNSRVKYSIVGSDHFSINEDTGAITVDSELDREIQDLHDFKLIAQDSSSINPKTSSASVMIKILDENDNKPTFDSNSTDYFIPPGLKPGDFILGLFASDKDHGDNAKIQFSLTGKDANLFELNRLNGVMIASRNFADKVAYDITVTVSDSSLRQDARLSIYLAEELIVPSFDNGATPPEVNLDEDVKVGSNVVTFKASGNIAGEDVNYAIAGGNIGNAFDVDHTSGVVLVNKTLDYETNDKYELWIKTFYKTRPLFTAAKKISIVVSDKNDNPPHFETNLVKVSIPEGVYPPFVITEVYAFDADTGPNGDISYSLVDDNTGIFVVDDQTGLIRCTQELDREVLDRYTLKLEAVDNGSSKRLSSTATILLTVQDVNDNPPRFTRLYSINVTENTAIGTNLLKLETVDPDSPENANVSFKLVNNPDNAFAIHDTMGNISIVQNLDREIRDEYGLRVQASDGTWQLETVITVTIQDANDNPPTFDQDIYEFNHAGDQSKKVGRVHALDRDSLGPNSEVSYELTHDSDFFDVDESSGDIMAKKNLKLRTMIDSYQIRIIAKDAGSPPMSSECQVIINLVNSNLNAPKFRGEIGEIGIPSSIGVGTTILQLNATDKDDNDMTKLLFKLAQPNDYFEIDDTSMKVLKSLGSLRGSSLELNITVNDQGVPNLQDSKTVKITITDDNQYSPEFQSPTTRIYIREDEAIDNVIITVRATDQDHGVNGFLEYFIVKGDPEAMFKIDKTTGSISVAKILDYEKIPVYNIIVQAEDRGFYSRSGTSSVKIILQDVDDNPPTFDQDLYEAVLEENAPIGTVVTQMIANDLDSAKNADIVYDMIDKSETDRYFNIDSVTGIVRALATFDYEQFSHTDLKIRARNPTSKDQSPAITTLRIQIQGKNEFFPRFKQPVFQFAVSESAQDGALVGQVEAVDNDAGPDGTVFYYFVGSSNGAGFVIDRKTGVIRVQDELDRESQHRYVLTVLAKNQGSIHGNDTDEAQIIVQVQDGNDPPVFRRSFYRAHVSEDAPHGTSVVTVSAVDKDVRPRNSQFIYVIADGNTNNVFSIGSSTGEIIVEDELDREVIGIYNLTVQAVDNGAPPAIGETRVFIELLDVNDSPPMLDVAEAFVKENSPPNSFVAQLTASDPDLPPNAGPFKYFLLPGSYSSLLSLDPESGILRTKTTLDREQFDFLDVTVEVQDAGLKRRQSNIKIEIGDENDNPSKARNVLVIIKNFEGTFPGGIILNVRPDDPDIKGNYNCRLISGPENIFIVNPDCSIKAGRIHNGREYELQIQTNDGKHSNVKVQAKLNFVSFSEFAVRESVSIRFQGVESSRVLAFFESIRASVDNRLIELLSLNVVQDGVVECFVASRENDLFLPREDTVDYLNGMDISDKFDNVITDFDPCDESPCLHGGKCSKETLVLKQTEITEAGNTIFNSPVLMQNITCECQPEYAGDRCQAQKNPCVPSPCHEGGQCFQESDSFRCLCPALRGGKRCEVQKTNACLPNPCLNGGSCQNAKKDNGFFCLCRPGYQGELCQTIVDTCRQNPCLNGGTCVSLKPNYKCRCHDHFYGNHCELSTFGLEEFSYASFPPLDANTNDISVIFATSKPNSLLVYNFGKSAGGRSDFLSVELVDGHPRLSWGGARTAITRLSLTNKRVDTGRWYKVTATRNNRVGSLSVEDCTESGEYCKACQPDDPRCFTKDIGEAGTLVFHKNPMFFGGLEDEIAVLDRPGQLDSVDFVGCIKSISINGNEKNLLTESLNRTGLTDTCNYVESGSCTRGDECGDMGTCIPLWSYHKCKCGLNSIVASDCGPSFQPFTLTENQEIHFRPSRKYQHSIKLSKIPSRWKREIEEDDQTSMSLTFRTLTSECILLRAINRGLAYTQLGIKEDGILEYRSQGSSSSSSEVVLSTDVNVADGSWHTLRLEATGNVLRLLLDESRVGYEVEFSAVHNFLDPNMDKYIIGNANDKGYRGCVTNFTLNNELQSVRPTKKGSQLLEADVPAGVHMDGCDVEILRVAQPKTAVDVGVTVVIIFFVVVLCTIAASFTFFKLRRKVLKGQLEAMKTNSEVGGGQGIVNRSLDLRDEQQLNNSRIPQHQQHHQHQHQQQQLQQQQTSSKKPDIIEADQSRPFSNFEAMEHYDIENASSIAPSDIDIVYHYKGYREGHRGRSLPKKRGRNSLNNTPLARLSPSSEMSHRILTLKDLSGKPLPTSLLTEQSERSLNSPVSHVSSGFRGLTSENVARFNQQRATPTKNSSSLVNTLDLVSMGSEKKAKAPTPNIVTSGTSTTSESSDNDDDSFTCSEYECDSEANGLDAPTNGNDSSAANMVFSKLMDLGPTSRSSSSRRRFRPSDEDDEEDILRPSRPDSMIGGRSWEHLLTWWPDYESFAGVFKDIAELPHAGINQDAGPDGGHCRPSPLGEQINNRRTEEEYI